MPDVKTWKSAGEEEDWLRNKAKLLAYITEFLANQVRNEFRAVPDKALLDVFGYMTPAASEYVRRAIFHEVRLSKFHKQTLQLYTVDAYCYVIHRYKGKLPDLDRYVDEMLDVWITSEDESFFARMHRLMPIYDGIFLAANSKDLDDDTIFACILLGQLALVVKERSGAVLSTEEEDVQRIHRLLARAGSTIHQVLAD